MNIQFFAGKDPTTQEEVFSHLNALIKEGGQQDDS